MCSENNKSIKVIAWMLVAAFLSIAFYSVAWGHQTIDGPPGYVVVETAYCLGMLLVFYTFGKVYCGIWAEFGSLSKLANFYERFVLPIGAIIFPFLLNVLDIRVIPVFRDKTGLLFAALLIVVLIDWSSFFRKQIVTALDNHDDRLGAQRLLYLKYPPTDRLDLLPQDILLNGTWIVLFVKHILTR